MDVAQYISDESTLTAQEKQDFLDDFAYDSESELKTTQEKKDYFNAEFVHWVNERVKSVRKRKEFAKVTFEDFDLK